MKLEKNKSYSREYAKYITEDTRVLMELWGDILEFGMYYPESKKFESWTSGSAGYEYDEQVTHFMIPEVK